jgi:hypothetical protein
VGLKNRELGEHEVNNRDVKNKSGSIVFYSRDHRCTGNYTSVLVINFCCHKSFEFCPIWMAFHHISDVNKIVKKLYHLLNEKDSWQ